MYGMINYASHVTELGNLQPILRAAAASNDWHAVERHALRMVYLATQIYVTAKAEGHAAELMRRADSERAAKQAIWDEIESRWVSDANRPFTVTWTHD
jgi:hypothetical protein